MKNTVPLKSIIFVTIFIVALLISRVPFVNEIESSLIDWRYRATYQIGKSPELSENIVLVVIDEKTVSELRTITPFQRDYLAALIEAVNELGAKTIALDIILDKPTEPRADSALGEAILKTNNIIIPGYFDYEDDSIIYRSPIPKFLPKNHKENFINLPSSTYQKRFKVGNLVDDKIIFSYPIILCASYLGIPPDKLCSNYGFQPENTVLIDFVGPAEAIEGFSAELLLKDSKPPREFFEDKIVFIGADFKDARDNYFLTPFSHGFFSTGITYMPGVKILVNATNTILKDIIIAESCGPIIWVLALVIAIVAMVIYQKIRLVYGILLFIIAYGIILIFGLYLFAYHRVICDISLLTLSFTSGIVSSLIFRYLNTRTRAVMDVTTGIFNRGYLNKYLESKLKIAKKNGNPLFIIFFDIDHFKKFNEDYSHTIGDKVLNGVGDVLQDVVDNNSIAAKYGGEELVIVLPGKPLGSVFEIAEGVRNRVKSLEFIYDGEKVRPITISGGIAGGVELPDTIEELYKQGSNAVKHAKKSGRDRIIVFHPSLKLEEIQND